ncbi:MAG: hypothetical protein NTW87_10220 [Planctomycetota bacterium]|nr:hypothetical protein [Planctomycetota bacterium]
MESLPFFIETAAAAAQPGTAICSRIRAELLRQSPQVLPFATTAAEAQEVAAGMRATGHVPAIFLINTLEARAIIPVLDKLMGVTPVVFFRRTMHAGRSGLMDYMPTKDPGSATTETLVKRMTPRLTAFWPYGSKTSDHVVSRALEALERFRATGSFHHFEVGAQRLSRSN